jgi:hypothetical protein
MSLSELAERCEQATGPDVQLDRDIFEASEIVPDRAHGLVYPHYAFSASLDAALTLVPEGDGRWPQVEYIGPNPNNVGQGHRWRIWFVTGRISGQSKATAALALCAAALRARASALAPLSLNG